MGNIYITPRARINFNEIWLFIAVDTMVAADSVYRRIMHKAQLAADNPHMGASRPELSSNARILLEGRYIIIYELNFDGISVIAVIHGMRNLDTLM